MTTGGTLEPMKVMPEDFDRMFNVLNRKGPKKKDRKESIQTLARWAYDFLIAIHAFHLLKKKDFN